ncbi:hypothetical protein MTsPCn5_31440 [Croceitalea sp. MTPC5]|nr:hypothetical protein MTsPCn5_31440 [Croceitalea sp. MTPC5]
MSITYFYRSMNEYLPLIIQLLAGAIGGNLAGRLLPKLDLGTLGNSLSGIVGGGLGGTLLVVFDLVVNNGIDMPNIVGSIASGGVGGGILMTITGALKSAISK